MPATPDPSADPSLRYQLPCDAPLLNNLAALWAIDPKLAAAIEATEATPSYQTESSKSGVPTLSIRSDSGRNIQLHSRYEPLDDARRLVEPLNTDDRVAFHIHGFGLGYHVEQLFERASSEAILCIIEPDLVLLRTAMELRDFSKLI